MKRNYNAFIDIVTRYVILVVVAIPNLWIFYALFTPLTVYPSYFLSKLFFDTILVSKTTLLINGQVPIDLIKSCIAGAAYYLLLILNLSVPKISVKRRLKMIGLSFGALLVFNIIRIVLLTGICVSDNAIFDITHKLFWYSLSTIFVVGIWFTEVKIFKIRGIPVYSDIKFLFSHTIKVR